MAAAAQSRVYTPEDLTVPCPRCGVGVRQRCKIANGHDAIGPHRGRQLAAADAATKR